MRLLFVNHLHPNTGLVGALRMQRFAEELAARGHRVLLLCACHRGVPDTPETFMARSVGHDWSRPLVLAVRDDSAAKLQVASRRTRQPAHRARTAVRLVFGGGPFWQWQRSAKAFSQPIRNSFAPELAYATFGNLDALAIARDYARSAGIPWVMDIKDPASEFIPKPLAWWLMPRYLDAAAVTLNAEFQRSHSRRWTDTASSVIYSGVETSVHSTGVMDVASVALVGSIRDDEAATTLLRGFAAWRQRSQPKATLHYFGTDTTQLTAVAGKSGVRDGLVVGGQIPRDDFFARCTRMAALLYVASPEHTFHHKLLELAALGRPIVTCPDEGDEARELCMHYGIRHTAAMHVADVARALDEAANTPTADMTALRDEMSWQAAAARLEAVFTDVLGRGNGAPGRP